MRRTGEGGVEGSRLARCWRYEAESVGSATASAGERHVGGGGRGVGWRGRRGVGVGGWLLRGEWACGAIIDGAAAVSEEGILRAQGGDGGGEESVKWG